MNILERIAAFRDDPEMRAELEAILKRPAMKEAMAIIKDLFLPSRPARSTGAEETKTNLALDLQFLAGVHEYPRQLEMLASFTESGPNEEPAPWGSLVDDRVAPKPVPNTTSHKRKTRTK